MKRRLNRLALLIILLLVCMLYLARQFLPPASQVFINANILTMDAENRVAEALALEGKHIVAVGSKSLIEKHIGWRTKVWDLGGKTLMPGFIDAHGHFPASGLRVVGVDLNSPPIGKVENIPQLLAALAAKAATVGKGNWIFGFGYDDTLLVEQRHPTRVELDQISTEHPIFLFHTSGHMGVANSHALALVGFDKTTTDPAGGRIVKDPISGELTGLVEEEARIPLLRKALDFSLWEFIAMVRDATAVYTRAGVTTAQNGAADQDTLKGLALLSALGVVPLRLEIWPHYDSLGLALLKGEIDADDYNNERLNIGAIKIIADGSIQGYTGFLTHPYHLPPKQKVYSESKENYVGYPTLNRDELTEWVGKYHRAGYQLAIHGNGDAAIDNILYAFQQAQEANPRTDPRMILVHAQMVRDDQLDVMKVLGVTPSFFSAHTYYWGDRHWHIFMGPERAARMSPTRSAQERGLRYSVHLDTPVVPMDPLMLVWSTVNRLSTSGRVIGAEQRVAVLQALRAVTIDAAWQIFRDHELGSIEKGKLADLVVLDSNPLDRPEAIRDIRVEQAWVGGVNIYQNKGQ